MCFWNCLPMEGAQKLEFSNELSNIYGVIYSFSICKSSCSYMCALNGESTLIKKMT